jgi:hypothetical protein
MAGCSDPRKALQWRRRLARFEKTQESIGQFCRSEGVSVASFYRWRRKLAGRREETGAIGDGASQFAAVRLVAPAEVSVRLPGGTQLAIPTSDPQVLQLAIQTLVHLDADRAGGAPC